MKKRKFHELGASMTVHSFIPSSLFIYLFKTTSLVLAFCCREIIINSKIQIQSYLQKTTCIIINITIFSRSTNRNEILAKRAGAGLKNLRIGTGMAHQT